jgi:broad specificity phosphatase PhoE
MNLSARRAFSRVLRNPQVLVVTHGAFLHFLTEDWDVDGNGGGNPLLSMC